MVNAYGSLPFGLAAHKRASAQKKNPAKAGFS